MNFDKTVYIVLVVFALVALVGFYLMFDKISQTENEINNLKLSIQLLTRNTTSTVSTTEIPSAVESTEPTSTPPASKSPAPLGIPTAILFTASSSPVLTPQTTLTVNVENISKSADGTVTLGIKIFTSAANSYSAIDPKTLFELVDLNGNNQTAADTEGQFNSMPPKSVVTGNVRFQVTPSQNIIILQIQMGGEDLKFYEFDFNQGTYKETVIG